MIDEFRHPFLGFQVVVSEDSCDISVVLLSKGFDPTNVTAAGLTTPGERIDPETGILVPDFLLDGSEAEIGAAIVASDYRVNVPMPRAHAEILFGYVSPDGRVVVKVPTVPKQVSGHLLRIGISEDIHRRLLHSGRPA
ncbi:MAG: hypothetical protein ABIP48_17420 [Planctomycetota bacterium]